MEKYYWQLCLLFSILFVSDFVSAQKVSLDNIKQQCTGLPIDKRVRLSVSTFTVATPTAQGKFGDELSQMLTTALQEVNCFNVLLSLKDIQNATDELEFNQKGNTDADASIQAGKMKGAQVIVMGKVTDYYPGTSINGSLGGGKAKIGFVIQLFNPQTREIIASKPINVQGKTFLGFGGSSNKSLADACEKGIYYAVEFIAANKDNMPLPEAGGTKTGSASNKFNANDCSMLKGSYIPKVMVILPEYHITQRLFDPAGETEINRKLVEAGFHVVDPAVYATIEKTAKFSDAAKDPAKAISLAKNFGADIVVYGEAFSQRAGSQGNMASCRARVEIRAVKTSDASIIATNGFEAGAVDNAEFVAAKSALRSAGALAGDYLLQQFCSKNISFDKGGKSVSAGKSVTEINILNADYSKLKSLADALAAKGSVVEKSITDGKGYIKLEHNGTTDVIADFINNKLSAKFSIDDAGSGKITLEAK